MSFTYTDRYVTTTTIKLWNIYCNPNAPSFPFALDPRPAQVLFPFLWLRSSISLFSLLSFPTKYHLIIYTL